MNTQKEKPTDAEEEFTGTHVPLHTLIHWNSDDVQVELRRALGLAGNLYAMSKELAACLDLFPHSYEVEKIADKIQPLLDVGQNAIFTRLISALYKLENL